MGEQKGYALVSMTNKDVYYIDKEAADLIKTGFEEHGKEAFVQFVDTKSGAEVTISLSNVSSIVVKGANYA
jgi:hypothetical protein